MSEKPKGNKLRDIVDTNRPFRMIYSGVENEKYFDLVYDMGIRDFLISYHYVQKKKLDAEKYAQLGVKFFIDSGAFTYQSNLEYQDWTVEQWEKQIVRYLNWAERNKDSIFAIANLDLENLIGVETVRRWNEEYFEPFMLRTGIPVCFIWHPVCGDDGWEYYCKRYPYVGFSWVADDGMDLDFNFGNKMLKIAEKYGAVCHGMGMTRTSLLPKLPFFTSDSTTWLVGLQYGEVNFWENNKMRRLKKDAWKGEYLRRIVDLHPKIEEEALLNENADQMVRANLMAFIQAEKYIQERMKARMYWLRADTKTRDRNDPYVFDIFPPLEWVKDRDNRHNNLEEYAKELNINHELEDKDKLANYVVDCTCFCNWDNPDFEDFIEEIYTEDLIKELHNEYINQITGSHEERIQELKDFFWEIVEGKNDFLLTIGTQFQVTGKERDKYIEEEDHELVDMSDDEVVEVLSKNNLLPSPDEMDAMNESAMLDDEIFSSLDIVPVRDERGRFLKGQKKVRKPKKVYSEKFPKLICDTCYAGQTCPEFKSGYVCAYKKMFNRFNTRDMNDITDAMQSMVELNLSRMQRATVFEMLEGGMPSATVTQMIDQNMRLLSNLRDMYNYSPEVLKQTRTVKADGTVETTTQVNANSGPSILEKLFFSDMGKAKEEQPLEEDVMSVKEELDRQEREKAIVVDGKIVEDK